ncbi:hypothetical protein BKH20_05045 [Actinomyces oris]|uniref:Uncharacterized protein n=1 Tax=Actinomyces oris TaxID=544580 RepID=A0A1Q8WS73_9ACTO|nr:hypothetical protein BKH20_05045 [Actinomyces oris]
MVRDGVSVSTALTSALHRRCTPKKNRSIPTIPAGCFDGWIVDVSAVDTGQRGSESAGFLRQSPAPPPQVRPLPAACAGARWSGFDAGSTPSRPTPRGSGSTGHGLYVLHEGPTYPQYPQPSSSSTPPSCSASRRRRAATTVTGAAPLRQAQATALPSSRPTPPMP